MIVQTTFPRNSRKRIPPRFSPPEHAVPWETRIHFDRTAGFPGRRLHHVQPEIANHDSHRKKEPYTPERPWRVYTTPSTGEPPEIGAPVYLTMDIRLGRRPSENLEFFLVDRSLLEKNHLEYRDPLTPIVSTEEKGEIEMFRIRRRNDEQNECLKRAWTRGAAACVILLLVYGFCQADSPGSDDEAVQYLKSLSLEELAGLEVTSVSRKREKLSDAPAAVFVITNEDIRRSGATGIPEALRMAPGVQVARVNSNGWAITSRGFNGYFANKLLVMIDGRTVYSPLYSGVYWNARDVLLEDVDRIEVIRGPGASQWGANAVNGVINVIMKSAEDTQGGLLSAGAGTYERGFADARFGGKIGDAAFRVYARCFDRDAGADYGGYEADDDWRVLRGGFRMDARMSDRNSLTVHGDAYAGTAGVTYTVPTLEPPYEKAVPGDKELDGGHLLARWTHVFSNARLGEFALQMYYDRTRNEGSGLNEVRDVLDVDFQHGLTVGGRHDVLWGMEYRWTEDRLEDALTNSFDPSSRAMDLFSLFIQDQITLVDERLWLILGARFENSYYTEWEMQPTGRLLWKPLTNHTFWAAISKAVRTPSRFQRDGRIDLAVYPPRFSYNTSSLPSLFQFIGNDDFESEEVVAHEIGWRFHAAERLFFDLSAFYNKYRNLPSGCFLDPVFTPGPPPHVNTSVTYTNDRELRTRGLELAVNAAPLDWSRLQLVYTHLRMEGDSDIAEREGHSPEHQIGLLSSMDFSRGLELDVWVRYVDDLPDLGVDGYVTLDLRLGWRLSENLEFSLAARNLLDRSHPEYVDDYAAPVSTEVERDVYGKVTWRF